MQLVRAQGHWWRPPRPAPPWAFALVCQKAPLEQPYLKDGSIFTGDRGLLYFDRPTLLSMMQGVAR